MTFTTFSFFLAGLAATLIPIALHLLSKGKPKKIVFPALRFVQVRLASNKRKLTLKRLLLLLLRVSILVVFGLALARPFIAPSQPDKLFVESAQDNASDESNENASTNEPTKSGIAGRDEEIAAAIVIDASVRMGRIRENVTLFDRALATARTILEQIPQGSEIAILDGFYEGDVFQLDRFAAKTRLDKLELEPTGRTVAESTLEAIALVNRSQHPTREIFVITDETRAGWSERDIKKIKSQLQSAVGKGVKPPTLYFVDLGNDSYRNVSITDLALSAETLSTKTTLRIDADIERVALTPGDVTVEAIFFDSDKLPNDLTQSDLFSNQKLAFYRESQTLSFGEGRSKRSINFQKSNLPAGNCAGVVRIVGGDALASDNERWFVVDVKPEWRLLVVAPDPIDERALFLSQALAPEELQRSGRAPFELDVIPYQTDSKKKKRFPTINNGAPRDLAAVTQEDLKRYGAALLLDPPNLNTETLKTLTEFVNDGGGLGVFLGRRATPIAGFQKTDAVKLLGFKPTKQTTIPEWDVKITPNDYDKPLLAPFRQFERLGIPWDALPIGRYWNLTELNETATVVARFSKLSGRANAAYQGAKEELEEAPAIIENQLGRGLVVTLATPISDSAQENPWNSLTNGDAAWVFVTLVDGIARRLASGSSSILNYSTGEGVVLRSPLKVFPAIATFTTPTGEEISVPTDVERRQLRFPGAKQAGVYRARTTPNQDGESIDAAFAVSIPAKEFDMTRYSAEDWTQQWKGTPYKTLDLQATSETLNKVRRGKESEPYAFLIVLLATLFAVEFGISNRFYKR